MATWTDVARVARSFPKEVLLDNRPRVYFTTPHFDGWPAILIRLPAIPVAELRDVMRQAWLARAPKKLAAEFLSEPTVKRRRGP